MKYKIPTERHARIAKRGNPRKTAGFVVIAMLIMLAIKLPGMMGETVPDDNSTVNEATNEAASVSAIEPKAGYAPRSLDALSTSNHRAAPYEYPLFAEYAPSSIDIITSDMTIKTPDIAGETKASPPKTPYKYAPLVHGKKPRIAVIIDDMGMNRKQSLAMIDIHDAPLTLAFLPYAPKLDQITKKASDAGHELMIHMPMEPMNVKIDTGAIALKDNMSAAQIHTELQKAFESFDGYVGLNNHMGSRVTQNPQIMAQVMQTLKERGIFYVDSKTISTSIAADTARTYGIAYTERDVFLDHETTQAYAVSALQEAERIAIKQGHAVVIGHPKAVTLSALKTWLPDVQARGFEIVPVSALLNQPIAPEHEPEQEQEPLISQNGSQNGAQNGIYSLVE